MQFIRITSGFYNFFCGVLCPGFLLIRSQTLYFFVNFFKIVAIRCICYSFFKTFFIYIFHLPVISTFFAIKIFTQWTFFLIAAQLYLDSFPVLLTLLLCFRETNHHCSHHLKAIQHHENKPAQFLDILLLFGILKAHFKSLRSRLTPLLASRGIVSFSIES